MRTLMEAYEREKKAGRDHPEWIQWCKEFADWYLTQQRPDGSFARSYMLGTQDVAQESGATSYKVAPLFPMLTKHMGDKKYLNSAIRAAEYVWQNYGCRGIFVGGAIDNPNITDKEAGMLSMEAFMSLYEATKDPKWLHRARIAGWQQEHWSLSGSRRGYGQPEKWMPWVTTNHLYGIYGMEDLDPVLFKELCTKPQ